MDQRPVIIVMSNSERRARANAFRTLAKQMVLAQMLQDPEDPRDIFVESLDKPFDIEDYYCKELFTEPELLPRTVSRRASFHECIRNHEGNILGLAKLNRNRETDFRGRRFWKR